MLITNKFDLPKSVFDALEANTYDLPKNDNIISVTRMIDSPKIAHLTRRHWERLEEDVSDRIWVLLGSAVHSVLERIPDEDRMIENRMYVDTETWEIVDKEHIKEDRRYIAGKPDLYEKDTCAIKDYKITSVWSVVYGKKEWEYQLNVYAWFYRKLGYSVNKLDIVAILRDWSKKNTFDSKDYPEIPLAVVNIPLWDFEKQDKYVKERVKIHREFENAKDDDIPECNEAERWHKPGTYAVFKNDNKRALRVFETAKEAEAFKGSLEGKDSNSYRLESRPGTNRRCEEYCAVNQYCHFYKKNYGVK